MVRCCRYAAEFVIDSLAGRFHVCTLHNASQVVDLLNQGKQPHAYWHALGKPIVLSCGPLEMKKVEGEFPNVLDDPMLAEVDDRPTAMVGAFCDLTQ